MIAALKFAWILVSFFTTSFAFAPTFRPSGSLISSSKVTRSLELYAAKKKVAAPAVDANGKEFWQGDWVCAGKFILTFCIAQVKVSFQLIAQISVTHHGFKWNNLIYFAQIADTSTTLISMVVDYFLSNKLVVSCE